MRRNAPRGPGPFLDISRYVIWTHGHNPPHTSYAQWPSGQLDAGIIHGRRAVHGKQRRRPSFTTKKVDISLAAIIVLFCWRSESGLRFLYSYNSRNMSWSHPFLSLTSPPRPRFCAEDLGAQKFERYITINSVV